MEFCENGELYDLITTQQFLNEEDAKKLFYQLIDAVEYIHMMKICHWDLKPENLLLDNKNNLKIIDFGLSNLYDKEDKLKTTCGSPCYASPEMIAGKKYHGLLIDIWSSGVILYAMLCGYLPFEDEDQRILFKKILRGEYLNPDFVSKEA